MLQTEPTNCFYALIFLKSNIPIEDHAYLLFWFVESIDPEGRFIFSSKLIKLKTSIGSAEKAIQQAKDILSRDAPPAGGCAYCTPIKDRV